MRRTIATGLAVLASLGLGQAMGQGSAEGAVTESRPASRPVDRITRMSDLVEGEGFSAAYPGDQSIRSDPRTVFSEDFEGRDPFVGWTDWKAPEFVRLVDAAPHSGNFALAIEADARTNSSGHLFKRLQFGQDALFVRFYVKFHSPAEYVQHFVIVSADAPARAFPLGGAGVCPDGGARFATEVAPFGARGAIAPPGGWHLHSYWCEMAIADDGKYWGNDFDPTEPLPIVSDRWTCVEVMVKANSTPQAADGEQAFWIDGKLAVALRGFRWRTDAKLKLNGVCLRLSMNEEAARSQGSLEPRPTTTVSFDDLVVATRYIGPQRALPIPTSGLR